MRHALLIGLLAQSGSMGRAQGAASGLGPCTHVGAMHYRWFAASFGGFVGLVCLLFPAVVRLVFYGISPYTAYVASTTDFVGGDCAGCRVPPRIVISVKSVTNITRARASAWRELNPELRVAVFDDSACRAYILGAHGESFARTFSSIRHGPIRADLFRVLYLYAEGGVYIDVDAVPVSPVNQYIDFSSRGPQLVVPLSRYNGQLNPMFMAATKGHRTLAAAVEVYRRLGGSFVYTYWSWSVVHVLSSLVYLGLPVETGLEEVCDNNHDIYTCFINNKFKEHVIRVRGSDYDSRKHTFVRAARR